MAAPVLKNFTQAVMSDTGTISSPADTAIGDLVIIFLWSQFTTTATTHTIQATFTEIRAHSHSDGTTCGRLSVASKIATAVGTQSYVPYAIANATAGQTCVGLVTVTGSYPYYPKSFPSGSITDTTNAAPNPPSLAALHDDMLILAIGAWQVTTAGSSSATVMANYTLKINGPTGSHLTHLAVASRGMIGLFNNTEDPAIYTDNVTPNGSVGMTIAIPKMLPSGAAPTAQDLFNRVDAATLGASWTLVDRTMGISGNCAVPGVLNWCSAYDNTVTYNADQYSEIWTGAAITGGGGLGPMVRMKPDFTYYYLYVDGSFVYIQKVVAGAAAVSLGTITWAHTAGDDFGLEVQGTMLKSYCNGVCKSTNIDSTIASGQPGLFCFGAGAVTNTKIDGWYSWNYPVPVGQPTMKRWGGIPTMLAGNLIGRTW